MNAILTNFAVAAALVLAAGCASDDAARLAELEQKNAMLRRELDDSEAARRAGAADPHAVPSFIVGLAATERDFDSGAFEKLLQESLASAAKNRSVQVVPETKDREIAKVRGMLLQQYLASAEIPVLLSNLSYRLHNKDNEFKIGGRIVPRAQSQVVAADSGAGFRMTNQEPIPAVMTRDNQGGYHVAYEELGGGNGNIVVQTTDAEILAADTVQRAQRQGDISFNWVLDLNQVHAYRVEGFRGDVGLFLANMRYPGVQSSIAQYQTMRDAVLLFGYGRYVTSVVNQIRTPAHITEVFVAPTDDKTFEAMQGRMTEQQVADALKDVRWERCEFVDFAGEEKIWARPAGVPFPFVSRQVSGQDKKGVFYLKYSSKGVSLIGDYER
jgi:hypothetical protein